MPLRNYTNTSVQTTLAGAIGVGDLSLTVDDATGYPSAPFAIVVDPDVVASEEVMLVTVKVGTLFTVTRAYDGTTAKAHDAGATVIHAAIAADFVDGQVAGLDTQVQFNDADAFAGAASLTYDTVTDATLFQAQANHEASLGAELLVNPTLEFNADGWSGAGWTWGPSPFIGEDPILTHDPLQTDILVADAPLANTDDLVLIAFNIGGYVAGALDVSISVGPGYSGGADSHAIITGDGAHLVVFFADQDNVQLAFNPVASGYSDVFDGYLAAPFSAKRISMSDPILVSKLTNDDDASIRIHLTNVSSTLIGQLTGRGMSTVAQDNLAVGSGAMEAAYSAGHNVAIGSDTLRLAPNAQNNIALGLAAMRRGQEARNTVAIGAQALRDTYQSNANVVIGDRAMSGLVTGSGNTVIGEEAGYAMTRGDGNVFIGAQAGGDDSVTVDYRLRISHWVAPVPLISGDFQDQTLTIGGDLDFSDDGQGPILIDRTTATRYRLYIDNGLVGFEEVV